MLGKTLFLLLLPIFLLATTNNFILTNDSIILDKTVNKINEIGNELFNKTNVRVYLSISKKSINNDIKKHIRKISKNINSFESKDTVLIALALDIKKIDIISSKSMQDKIDKDKILNKYVIPFFIGHDKNSQISKYSAGILNGYSQLAEDIANSKNIKLSSAIYNGSKNVFDIVRLSVYLVLTILFLLFLYRKFK